MGSRQEPSSVKVKRHIIIRLAAENDLSAIFDWYESASSGLGTRFITSFEAGLSYIDRFPESSPLVYLEYRRLLIKRFPYGVLYIVRPTFVSIVAIFHLSRDPSWIQQQLEKRL